MAAGKPVEPLIESNSAFTSSLLNSLHCPGCKSPIRIQLIRTRRSFCTVYPSASHMRRICRFNPCTSTRLKDRAPVLRSLQGNVIVFRISTPLIIFSMNSRVSGLSTSTSYSFSWPPEARSKRFTISPSLVSSSKPSESLSRRPTGKIRMG